MEWISFTKQKLNVQAGALACKGKITERVIHFWVINKNRTKTADIFVDLKNAKYILNQLKYMEAVGLLDEENSDETKNKEIAQVDPVIEGERQD